MSGGMTPTPVEKAAQGDWIEWTGDASSIPTGFGWVQFLGETRKQAELRQPQSSQIDFWPWFGEDERPCVLAYRLERGA